MGFNPFQPLAEIPVIGGLFGPDSETRANERRTNEALSRLRQGLSAYRPQARGAHLAGLQSRLDAFGPVNSALVAMYGPEAAIDVSGLAADPFARPATYAPPRVPLAPPAPSTGMPTAQLTSGPGAGMPGFVGDTYPGGPPRPRSQPGFGPMLNTTPNPFGNARGY